MRTGMRKVVGLSLAAMLTTGAVVTTAGTASATDVTVTGKGVAGGALIGAEVGAFVLDAAGAHQTWEYIVVPGLLAVGGGVGGYFVEQDTKGSPGIPMAIFGVGLGLVIPALVATVSANQYQPPPDDITPLPAAREPAVQPAGSPTHSSLRDHRYSAMHPSALLNFDDSRSASAISFAMPAIQVLPSYTLQERAEFGVPQRYEVHAPVFAISF